MKVEEWIEAMSRSGHVCREYLGRLTAANTNGEIFRILCDANGGRWLFEKHNEGVPMPMKDFMTKFSVYNNGNRVMEYPKGYTSKIYCRYDGDLVADTTLVYLLESRANITVPKDAFPTVILSDRSSVKVSLSPHSRLNVELYGNATYELTGDTSRVRVTKVSK